MVLESPPTQVTSLQVRARCRKLRALFIWVANGIVIHYNAIMLIQADSALIPFPEKTFHCVTTSPEVQGYLPTCSHSHTVEDSVPGIVLDPFVGSGTTVMVANQLLRRAVGVDISMQYLDEQAKVRAGLGSPSKQFDDLPMFEID